MTKKPADNVNRLIAQAGRNKAAKAKKMPTVAKEMHLRKQKPKSAPTHVLSLIAQAMKGKKGSR